MLHQVKELEGLLGRELSEEDKAKVDADIAATVSSIEFRMMMAAKLASF